jgi:hypothetical protein
MAAPLAGVAPMYALCFLGYGVGKNIFCDDDAFDKLKLHQIGMAGAVSAFFTTPILGPGLSPRHYVVLLLHTHTHRIRGRREKREFDNERGSEKERGEMRERT